MPTFRSSDTVAIGGTVANIMAGSQFEFLARPSIIQIFSVQDLADLGEIEVFFGQELQLSVSPIPQFTAGQGPLVPDHELVNDVGAPGDRLVIRLTESGGAATAITRTMVKITPV